MVRTLHKLTARGVATASKAGRHSDGGGLYLSVDKAGRRRWTFMTFAGKQTELGLGSAQPGVAGSVTLAEARKKAAQIRERLAQGLPAMEKATPAPAVDSSEPVTFGDVADSYIAAHEPSWRNDKHRAQWRSTLATYAQQLRNKPIDQISEDDVLGAIEPIWREKPETASRVRGRIEAVLDFARARKLRSGDNPARWKGHLEHVLPTRLRLSRGHHPATPYPQLPDLFTTIGNLGGVSPKALQFTILTAARSGEVRGATWGEIDLKAKIWTVPAARMKAGREHVVPLSTAALEIVTAIRSSDPATDDLLFGGPRTGRPLSDMTLSAVLRRMKVAATVHGFRSSFRDWAGDCTAFDRDTVEAALAHTIRDQTERAYRRGSALEKRRELMELWANYCGRTGEGLSTKS